MEQLLIIEDDIGLNQGLCEDATNHTVHRRLP